ncbi:low temperature requirement protein A [Nitrobacter sp. TKz-YC02]|uniref:low temperature requirement protein A n=1 Tax=Nitrobacter sp. TKz-YC02 TaxID=3398704 RepID=UPI003CF14C0E
MARIAYFRLPARDRDEANRGSTSLELMFDLATVVAVAAAAHGLAQDVSGDRPALGAIRFVSSFFMAWLAWMNYTWFASGYDNKSIAFRALSMVIIFGSLTLAGGIQNSHGDQPIWLALVGFTIMRLGMIALWLGAANGDPDRRPTALRYAGGIGVMQFYWYGLILVLPPQAALYLPLFALGAAGELAIPVLAEWKTTSNWHHDHIVDRYNMFNIIVLGECFASIAMIIADAGVPNLRHFWLAVLCFAIAFSMWGLYFDRKEQLLGRKLGNVLLWAYGHYILFAAGAATAAGFAVSLDVVHGGSPVSEQVAALAIGVPITLYLSALWLVRDRTSRRVPQHWLLLGVAALILGSSAFSDHALELVTALLVVAVMVRRRLHPARERKFSGTSE